MTYLHEDDNFKPLLDKIHAEHGVDLRDYRPKCLGRRIASRLREVKISSLKDYIRYLDENPGEYKLLMDAATINVTNFFRNAEVFEAMKKEVLPELFERKKKEGKRVVRIWSAGCSSGEEPYTLAILLLEFLGERIKDFTVKVYGTDIDKKMIDNAVLGEYEADALREMPQYLRDKYFLPDGKKYIINDKPRLITRFLKRDLIQDKPIDNIDLILCRNVVIYFTRDLTAAVYAGFYEALSDKGYLVLGKVEALWGEINRYFKAVDQKERIYQKLV